MLDQCWPTVYDVGPTLDQHCVDVSCLLRIPFFFSTDASRASSTFPLLSDTHRMFQESLRNFIDKEVAIETASQWSKQGFIPQEKVGR